MTWVPAGATITGTMQGTSVSAPFSFGHWETQFTVRLRFMADSGIQRGGDLVALGHSIEDLQPHEFGPTVVSWTNTGAGEFIASYIEPSLLFARSADFTLTVSVTGGDGWAGPDCQPRELREMDTGNAGEPGSCGAEPVAADPVNVVQGNFWESWTDATVPGRGPELALQRTYASSRTAESGPFGPGWSFSYGMNLSESGGVARVAQENGALLPFYSNGSTWVAPSRVNARLVEDPGSSSARWVLTRAGREVFRFDAAGHLTSVSDLSGNTTTLNYNGVELASVVDPSGRELSFTWNQGRVVQVAAPEVVLHAGGPAVPMSISYGYDAAGDLTSVTEPDGRVWSYGYDLSHRMVTVREPRHHSLGVAAPVVENHYDALGRVDWQEDRLDRRTTFDWAAADQTTVTDPSGNVTVYEHVDGICTGIIRDPGPDQSVWSFDVDPQTLGRRSSTDPNGIVTSAVFNRRGLPASITTPSGTTSIVYDPVTMMPMSVTDPSGVTTTYSYSPGTDQLIGVSRPITPGTGTWTIGLAYGDPANPGLATAETDARGKVSSYTYDSLGDVVSATDPTGKVTTWGYNSYGWPLWEVAPAGNAPGGVPGDHQTSYEYDQAGNVVKVTDPLGAATEYGMDPSGLLEWVKDPVPVGDATEQTSYSWNAAGELETLIRPDGSTLTNEFWPNGSLKAQRDGASNPTSYAYDAQGRLATVTDPAGRITTYGYDPGGRVISKQLPGGTCASSPPQDCVQFSYFSTGELQTIDYSNAATPDVSFGYDELGRRTSMTDGAGTSAWSFDSVGRLLSSGDPAAGTVTYGYADNGPQATTVTYPGGKVLQRGFDDAGRQISQQGWTGGGVSFGYDDNSNPTTTDTAATGTAEDTVDFDHANRPTAHTLRQGTSVLASLGYTRDPEGMIRSVTGTGLPGLTDSYTYTPLDQLASDATGAYQYDPAGNLTGFPDGRHQRFNAANEICYAATTNSAPCTSAPGDATTYTYDSHGNRVARRPAAEIPDRLSYDQADRLVAARLPALAGAEGQFHAATPTRILSTVAPVIGSCTPSPCARLTGSAPVTVAVSGTGGVPTSGVRSVTLAVHVANPSSSGWLFVDPSDATSPTAVAMLYNAGQDTTNTVVVEPGPDGRIRLESLAAANVYIDVLGWHSDADAPVGGLLYGPAPEPVRVLSTAGTITGSCTPSPCGRLAAWTTTTIQVTGVNGVPTQDISAVNVVVHAINPAGPGWLTLWPAGSQMPAAAQLAYDAQYSSALVTVPVSETGSIQLFTANATDVALDVVGWYGPATTGEGLVAHDVPAQLITDTRSALGTCDPSPCTRLTAGQTTTTKVAGAAGIPADADAVAVILHAVNPGSAGYLVASSPSEPTPGAASLTFSGGAFVSGAVVVPVDAGGNIALWSTTPVDIIVQTVGWYEQATRTWTYTYTGDGLRRTKTSPDGTTTTFTWDRSTPLPLLLSETIDAPDTQDDRTIRYLHGPGGAVTADITTPSSGEPETLRWYHHDQIGSTRALTDATGAVIGTYAYDPSGKTITSTGTATTPIGWAGEYKDPETGYVYLRARHYDPATGQFLTRDPIEPITREPYSYAGNNPINRVDPTGLDWWDPRDNILPAIGGGAEWAWDHRGQIATAAGIGVCAYATLGWCAVATGTAFFVRAEQRVDEMGWDCAFEANAQDALVTTVGFGLVSVPTSFISAGSQGAHLARVDRGILWGAPRWQQEFARWVPALPGLPGLLE